jgi:hypothetical protein
MVDVAGFTFVIHIGWLVVFVKIGAKMATIMAAMAAIFKSHLSLSHSSGRKSSKYQFSNFAQFRI